MSALVSSRCEAAHHAWRQLFLAIIASWVTAGASFAVLRAIRLISSRANPEGLAAVSMLFIFLGATFGAYFAAKAITAASEMANAIIRWVIIALACLPPLYFTLLFMYLATSVPGSDLSVLRWTHELMRIILSMD